MTVLGLGSSLLVIIIIIIIITRVNNIRRGYLMPYRAVKYDCVKLKGFFSYNSVILCILDTRYIIAL